MRRLFEKLTRTLNDFVKQRDNLLLLIACGDNDVALVLKALRELDRHSKSNLFLLFADNFAKPDQYVASLANTLREEWKLTNEAVGAKVEKLPPLPTDWFDGQKPPPDRLRAGLSYGRSLVDPRKGQRYLWGMAPLVIQDSKSYLELLATLPPKDEILPWMRGARIAARVPADFKLDQSPLAKCKRVVVEPFVIPPNIHELELAADAADPKAPMADKMQAEVQLAYLDYAHSRFDVATARFRKALAFFQWAEVPVMEGLIISGMGDIARRQEKWDQANHWYSCAVVPAAKAENPMLMSTIVQNLAVIAYRQNRFADAEERYAELVILKRAMIDEVGLAEALEWQGIAQEKQNAYDRAVVCWEESALICKSFEMKERLGPVVSRLKTGYQRLGMREELANFDAEWNGA